MLAALSPVFVQLVLPITVSCASVTYLLSVLSAISAVVASSPQVTSHLASYVILVLVAQVIAVFTTTLSSANSSIAFCTLLAAIQSYGLNVTADAVVDVVPAHIGKLDTNL